MILPRTAALGRRGFLGVTAASLTALPLAGLVRPSLAPAGLTGDPFRLGVASGDPLPDGVVLWTRIAPDPVAEDGLGGVPDPRRPIGVRWEVSTDETFRGRSVVRRGVAVAEADLAHSVHVEVDRLQPDRVYWYRFRVGAHISPVGRTRTAPAQDAVLGSMTFAFMSCQAYNNGYFTALRHLAADDLDVAFHLGDYIYEGGSVNGVDGRVNRPLHELVTLSDYRIRYGLYKSDPDLQAAHASVAFVSVPDNHDIPFDHTVDPDPPAALERRAAAYQAYYENLPLRRTSLPSGPAMQLFRRVRYGRLADFHVLDTQQYASDQALDETQNLEIRDDPDRTLLGDRQEQWLLEGMTSSTAAWNVLAQQSKVAETDDTVGPGEDFGGGGNWDGYDHSRETLFDAVHERGIDNMVVVSGDAHANMAADLKPRSKDPDSPVVGAEFLGTSISTGGDGQDLGAAGRRRLEENPHVRFYNNRRGYQRCVVTPEVLRTDYLVLPSVTTPDAPVVTRAVGYVENGRPGVAQVEDGTVV
ncbi:alkaline phosphatase D family protein [Auraticoccus monumenti]|uniref:Alkaline phosphatase D n=1 Tax=Auraticoccus monumenti TaxID=675864 RepID=A0A1G6YGZ4_9ACTN|nr:alkaline phosphatase D family protein [Auraticoccus monumenti]SDD88816.1 alkaline phosphatase D [Auraticoccus monumenti]